MLWIIFDPFALSESDIEFLRLCFYQNTISKMFMIQWHGFSQQIVCQPAGKISVKSLILVLSYLENTINIKINETK